MQQRAHNKFIGDPCKCAFLVALFDETGVHSKNVLQKEKRNILPDIPEAQEGMSGEIQAML
jgi:hypothetical protein